MGWKCSECGIDWETADRRRRRRGQHRLHRNALTCGSIECRTARMEKVQRKWFAREYARDPSWRCAECGCTREVALRKRKRLGLPPGSPASLTCTPECQKARRFTVALKALETSKRGAI